jgi:hypothetical protein
VLDAYHFADSARYFEEPKVKIDLRIERLPNGAYFVWHDWRRSDPIAGSMPVGRQITLADGRMVLRQGDKRVKWYIPPSWLDAMGIGVSIADATTPTGGKNRAGC